MNSVYAPTIKAGIKMVIFILIAVFLTYILAGTIGNTGSGGPSTTYKADFTDVTGLLKGDDVRIAGVKVGSVKGIKIEGKKYAQVSFGVDRNVPLHVSSTMQVRYQTLVGQRYLALTAGTGSPMKGGDVIPLGHTSPALDLTTLLNGFKPLFTALDPATVNTLSFEIIQVLQGEGGTLDTLLTHTASLTNTIADHDQVIGQVIDNLDSTLAVIAARDGQLTTLIKSLQQLVTGLNADRNAILGELDGVNSLVTSTTSYLQAVRPPIKDDVSRLNTLANTLDNGKGKIDKELNILPRKLTAIVRTATYGGWFNFYLCKADGQIILPTGQTLSVANLVKTNGAQCNANVNAENVYAGGGAP